MQCMRAMHAKRIKRIKRIKIEGISKKFSFRGICTGARTIKHTVIKSRRLSRIGSADWHWGGRALRGSANPEWAEVPHRTGIPRAPL